MNMFANVMLVICGFLVHVATCEPSFKSTKFIKVRQGARASVDLIADTFGKVSLIQCSVRCSKDPSCNAFQFSKPSGISGFGGSCQLLNHAETPDVFDSSITEDISCNIYRAPTYEETATEKSTPATTTTTPATTSITTATTPTTPTTIKTSPICDYANQPVSHSCNCSTASMPCSGTLQCTATYADKSVYYYMDRSEPFATYDLAVDHCSDLGLKLIMIKTMEEQSTICNILADAVGTSVAEDFWMAMRNDPGSSSYTYADGTSEGSLDVWNAENPHGCVYLAGSANFKWEASKKCGGKEINVGRAICSKDVT